MERMRIRRVLVSARRMPKFIYASETHAQSDLYQVASTLLFQNSDADGLRAEVSAYPCHRAVATTPPECPGAYVRLRRSMLPSLRDRELGLGHFVQTAFEDLWTSLNR